MNGTTKKQMNSYPRSRILGMPVITIQEGFTAGSIKQILLDGKTYRVQGFLVERNRHGKEDKVLPFLAVHGFGKDSITIESFHALERKGGSHQYIRAIRQPLTVTGARVFTENGHSMGKVTDYSFSTEDGSIALLELGEAPLKEHVHVPGKTIIAIAPQTVMLRDVAWEQAVPVSSAPADTPQAEKDTGSTAASTKGTALPNK